MPNQPGFQTIVNNELPLGVLGDFAGANIRTSVPAPPFGYVAPGGGTLVGAFGWGDPSTKIASNYYKPNAMLGFVHRENQALITSFLGISTLTIPQGLRVTLYSQGDFLGLFTAGATVGQKVYADPVTGALTANATGNAVTASSTTAAITSSVLTTTDANNTGTPAIGQAVTGGTVPEGTYIASSGGTGSGTHIWNLANVNGTAIPNNASFTVSLWGVFETPFYVASNVLVNATFTGSLAAPVAPAVGGILTVTTLAGGLIIPGQFLTATGGGGLLASQNVQVLNQLTYTTPSQANGGGGTGTYLTNYAGAAAVTSTNTFIGTQGQIGKISSWTT